MQAPDFSRGISSRIGVFDDAVIAFLLEKCVRQSEESEKRELVIVWEIRDFSVKLFFLFLYLLPMAIAAMLAGL